MKMLIQGDITDFAPLFKSYVRKEGLLLGEEGNILLTVDTGFSGGIALSLLPFEFITPLS